MVDSILANTTFWAWVAAVFFIVGIWCIDMAYAFWYEYGTYVIPVILLVTTGGAFYCTACIVTVLP